ncbi:MAG: ComEC/Rec2 family competence protein [Rhodoglobus sp.]|nr:ComEC/Rec2 family competence protein [Rhodoglobus sp.]
MTVDLRLALPGVAGWIAAGIVIALPGTALPVAVGLWLAAAVLLALRLRWTAIAALALAAAALCCTSIAMQSPARQPAFLVADAAAGRQVAAVATTTATVLPGRGSFGAELTNVAGTRVSVPVLVFGERPDERVGIGTTISLSGTLTVADAGDDIAFLFFTERQPAVTADPPWFLDWANGLRAGFLATATKLPGDGGDLLAGLAIGDTSAVSDRLDAAMKASSLSHLTAVSGANCAVVIGLAMVAGAALGLRKGLRIAASVAVLVAFVVLVTPEPSVLRAAVMAALVLLALLGGRPVRGIPVLALATIGLLVNDPWLARSYGFALSVLATGGLLLLAGPLAKALGRWMPRWLALTIAVPLAAQLACQPVIILLNASLPTYGVVANVLAAPAAPVATVLGLAACVAVAVLPPLGPLLAALAWLPSAWIAAIAQFFSTLPGAQLPWPGGLVGVGLLAGVTSLAVFAAFWRGRGQRWIALGLALCLVGYVGLAGGNRVATLLGRPGDWQIAGCDIGQGDAFIVRSEGQVALIDTGPKPERLTKCLTELGIDRINLLVLTHYDLDHVGGVDAVIGIVDRAFLGPSDGSKGDHLAADLLAGGALVQQVSRGPSGLLGDLRWSILWPPKRLVGIEPGNPASVTIEFDPVGACPHGCLSSIFLGDLGEHAQDLVLAANPLGPVDVVKVGHHGSADQSEAMYARLQATIGMIGVGVDNGYGHPTQALLDILARVGTTPVRTDLQGMMLLEPGDEPGTVRVWTER